MFFPVLRDLLAHHAWAQKKLLARCAELDDEALDASLPLGPGSLRATLTHMWGAEVIWLTRWKGNKVGFPAGPPVPVQTLDERFTEVADERAKFLEHEASNDLQRIISYQNLKGDALQHRLADLVLHVANHAIHHRAQALQFLRHAGVTFPGGLDYIFYRISRPTVLLKPETVATCRKFGLEVGDVAENPVAMHSDCLLRYGDYGDWGMQKVLDAAQSLSSDALDKEFSMGMGTLRKTLIHMYDAERWWQGNWAGRQDSFPRTDIATSISELQQSWNEISIQRRNFVARQTPEGLAEIVSANFGAGVAEFRIGESLLQLACHGTHHRAQAVNMLRRVAEDTTSDVAGKVPALDVAVWLREQQ